MEEFNTSVLREKFTLRDEKNDSAIRVGSNRMVLPLEDDSLIIRGKFMHEVAKFGAFVLKDLLGKGFAEEEIRKYDWDAAHEATQRPYDRTYFPEDWLVVYHEGKPIFKHGVYHPFLDIIEQCDLRNPDEYDFSVAMAEDAFRAAGKSVAIDHLSTIALVAHGFQSNVRCGVIYRNITKTRTFNFTATEREDKDAKALNPFAAIHTAAIFLEGLHLAFVIAIGNHRINHGEIKSGSEEFKQNKDAKQVLGQIQSEVESFNRLYDVRYRPEMPSFDAVIKDVEKYKKKHA